MSQTNFIHAGWKRAAWPELRIQRLERSRQRLPSSIENLSSDIRNHAYTLLKKYNLLYRDEEGQNNEVLLEMLQQPMEPDTARPTIRILALWSPANDVAFRNLAQEMVDWVANWTVNVPQRIDVEITALENVQTIYYGAVNDRALSEAWDSTRESIRTLLESLQNTRGSLTCLGLLKYGVNPEINANPPTIYISMDHRSDESGWHYIATCVKELLDKQGWKHVQVHIEHNLNMYYAFRLLPIVDNKTDRIRNGEMNNKQITSEYRNEVHIGDDIAAACYPMVMNKKDLERDPGLGTLGCFVQIKTTNHQYWRTMILTNYHVVRPAFAGYRLKMKGSNTVPAAPDKDSDLWYVDVNGYSPANRHNLKAQVHGMESPSRTKHNFTITVIQDDIAELEEDEVLWQNKYQSTNDQHHYRELLRTRSEIHALKAEMQRKKAFFDDGKQAVGKIFLCSGFPRKANGRRMDWALVSLDKSRSWSNCLPDKGAWSSLLRGTKPKHTYNMPITDPLHSMEQEESLGHVYKVGTATQATNGDIIGEKQNVRLIDDVHLGDDLRNESRELIIQPAFPGKFCSRGDSGSAVFDSDGGIVGLFFSGHKINGTYDEGFGYATPIELVFQDIIEFSEHGVTDIRIAQQ